MGKETTIEVMNLTKTFQQTTALKEISLQVTRGEIFGFLGPSGSGKTTTIKILTGQLLPTSGTAFVLGRPITNYDERLYEQIGIVTHQSGLYDKLTVEQNLQYFAKLRNLPKQRVSDLLQQVGLSDQRRKKAAKLSQGMRQRLVLARAILHQPRVLFLDEPTSGLDPSTNRSIHQLIRELSTSGTTVFLTTHDMLEATRLCDRVALLNNGKIAECASPTALRLKYNRQQSYQVRIKSQSEPLTLPASEATAQQIQHWMTSGELETIHSCEPTLEDVFLTVTGRKLQ